MKSTSWIALGVFAAVSLAGWLVADRIGERERLRRALAVAGAGRASASLSGSDPSAAVLNPVSAELAAEPPDGAAVLTDMLAALHPEYMQLLEGGFGWRHPTMGPARAAVLALSSDELSAVLSLPESNPVFTRSGGAGRRAASLRSFAMVALQSVDPQRALGLLDLGDASTTEEGIPNWAATIDNCLEHWAATDPLAAVRWAKKYAAKLPEGDRRVAVALGVMARNDLPGAWEEMRGAGLEPGLALPGFAKAIRSRDDVNFCMEQIRGDTGAAPEDWASELGVPSGSSLQTCVCIDFALRLNGSRGWEEARAFLGEWATTPEALSAAASTVVMETVTGDASDPGNTAAAEWLVATLPEAHRSAEVTTLVEAWADRDFTAPAEWLRRQPSSEWRDAGLAALCGKLAPFDPAAAAEWSAQITDPALRADTLETLSKKQ